jgi:asparagine synthase (glutamine-hydrolysing)
LTGDGGDESFAGYTRYSDMLAWSRFDQVPEGVRRALRYCATQVASAAPYGNTLARVQRGVEMLFSPLPARYDLMMSLVKAAEKKELYSAQFKALVAWDRQRAGTLPWAPSMDALDWMMRHDQNFYLPDCLMVKADIAAMANSLELRSPFLDHRMVEFAARIPSELKQDGARGKRILRNAVRALLPPEILDKRKTGFGVPLAQWFRGELAPLLHELLLDERCRRRNLLSPVFLRRMVDEHLHGVRDWSNRLWALVFLEAWFREFID